jgi:hypothetical protein
MTMAIHNGDTMDECSECGQTEDSPDCDSTLTIHPGTLARIRQHYADADRWQDECSRHCDDIGQNPNRTHADKEAFRMARFEKSIAHAKIVGEFEALLRMAGLRD